jgi:peptidoglycan/xylan/chitin deacetylase (PgdA/CDA1 family)
MSKHIFDHATRYSNKVAITFDDGPNIYWTEKFLDKLKELHFLATFFVCGKFAEFHKDIIRRMDNEGHSIGNHSYSHLPTAELGSPERVLEDYRKCDTVLMKILGRKPKYVRAPYYDYDMFPWSYFKGRYVIGCERDSQDWLGNISESEMIANIMVMENGCIISFHDGYGDNTTFRDVLDSMKARPENTYYALERVLQDIKKNNFIPTCLDNMVLVKDPQMAVSSGDTDIYEQYTPTPGGIKIKGRTRSD